MTQNIYDRDEFFDAYCKLSRSVHGLDAAPEWPALRAMVGSVAGARVLDLGCGFGWLCRWAREAGATHVVGIDVSEKMLARARCTIQDAAIEYRRANLEDLDLAPATFDIAYSSLVFHYVENLERLIVQIHRALTPGAHLVFSVEHPLYTAPSHPGWSSDEAGRKIWPLDSYLREGVRTTDWLASGVVKQHRTLATILNMLLRAGFVLAHINEWGPSDEQIAAHPDWASERDRPGFLLVSARR